MTTGVFLGVIEVGVAFSALFGHNTLHINYIVEQLVRNGDGPSAFAPHLLWFEPARENGAWA